MPSMQISSQRNPSQTASLVVDDCGPEQAADPLGANERGTGAEVSANANTKLRRIRLNFNQLTILEQEFSRNADWDRAIVTRLATRLNMTNTKVYKWHWDRVRKEQQDSQTTLRND